MTAAMLGRLGGMPLKYCDVSGDGYNKSKSRAGLHARHSRACSLPMGERN